MTNLTTLRSYLSRNRFLPVPPPELMFVGDGDFRSVGAEFLQRVVDGTGLRPDERVLDIGCGVGRLAIPLSQYLEQGTYDGVDPVGSGIEWCKRTITTVYPSMRFHHLDLNHSLYNPAGKLETANTRLPFDSQSIDVICMISVLTHLEPREALHYATEVSRLLAPGGRCFATAFLMNPPARAALGAGRGSFKFDPEASGPVYFAEPEAPLAAVAYDEDTLLEFFLRNHLVRRNPAVYGSWSGRNGSSFQDICVFDKAAAP